MHFFTDKFAHIRAKIRERGLDDPRLLGIVVLAAIGLSVVWNGARVVQQNYGLLQQIAVIEEENRILELENSNRKLQNQYYQTPEYAELKARRVNGKAAAGERVYIVTNQTAEKSLKTAELDKAIAEQESKPRYQENFEAWMDFFFSN